MSPAAVGEWLDSCEPIHFFAVAATLYFMLMLVSDERECAEKERTR